MDLFKRLSERNKDLFVERKAKEVHPHDVFLKHTLLRIVPHWIKPNHVTLFRLLATPLVFWVVFSGELVIGIIAFALVASTDAIDGSMARTRNQVTRFGMMFDPLADKLLVGSMVVILVFQHYNFWLGLSIILIEVAFVLSALIGRLAFNTVRMANIWGKIKMILQVTAICVTMLALLFNFPLLLTIGAWIFGLAIGFAILSLFSHGI